MLMGCFAGASPAGKWTEPPSLAHGLLSCQQGSSNFVSSSVKTSTLLKEKLLEICFVLFI